jgi:hypothetical protein
MFSKCGRNVLGDKPNLVTFLQSCPDPAGLKMWANARNPDNPGCCDFQRQRPSSSLRAGQKGRCSPIIGALHVNGAYQWPIKAYDFSINSSKTPNGNGLDRFSDGRQQLTGKPFLHSFSKFEMPVFTGHKFPSLTAR